MNAEAKEEKEDEEEDEEEVEEVEEEEEEKKELTYSHFHFHCCCLHFCLLLEVPTLLIHYRVEAHHQWMLSTCYGYL